MKKRILAIFLSMLLIITGTLSYYPEDVFAATGAANGTVSGAAGESSTGTRLSYGYRIGIGYLNELKFKFNPKGSKTLKEQFIDLNTKVKAYAKHNYVKVANPKEAIYCSIYNPAASSTGRLAGTKIANPSNGGPSETEAAVFYEYLTPRGSVREETNYIGKTFVGTKGKQGKLAQLFYGAKGDGVNYDKLMNIKTVIKDLEISKSKCEQDIKELLATDTKMGTSFKHWLGLYVKESDGTKLNSIQFLYQYAAMLELYVVNPTDNTAQAIKDFVKISENADTTVKDFPAIVVESTISAYNGAKGWWLSPAELLAYTSNCNVSDFLTYSKPNGKEYTSILDVYVDKFKKKDGNLYKNCPRLSSGWAAKMFKFAWRKERKFSGDRVYFDTYTGSAGKSWLTGIRNEGGPEGYFFATEFFYVDNDVAPKEGSFTWNLSEGKETPNTKFKYYNVVKKKWGEAISKSKAKLKSHKVKVTNINIYQDKEKVRDNFESWIKKNNDGKFEIIFGIYRKKAKNANIPTKDVADILTNDKYISKYSLAPKVVDSDAKVENSISGQFVGADGNKKNFSGKVGSWNEVSASGLLGMLTKGKTNFTFKSDILNTTVTKNPVYYHYIMTVKIKLTKPNGKTETVVLDNNYKLYTGYKFLGDGGGGGGDPNDPNETYTVYYYYNDVLDEDATVSKKAPIGSIIKSYTPKPKDNFTWNMTTPKGEEQVDGKTNLKIEKGGENIIEVYYSSKPKEYYYESAIETPYAEIKCGYVNDSGATEPYEAMAGFPTTENLYFASGGKEFMVQLKYEYVKEQDSFRTYTQKSSEAKTSLYIPYKVKQGAQDSATPGPKPADEVVTCPTCGETIKATYLPFRVQETRWNWKGETGLHVPKSHNPCPGGEGHTCPTHNPKASTSDKAEPDKIYDTDCDILIPQKKVKATRWNWEWRCYGHGATTASQSESLPYTSGLKTYNNVHTQTTYKKTHNGRYTNVKTTVSNSSANGTFNNQRPNGNIFHHISWDQKITDFNYAKITDVRVWQLKEANVKNTYEFSGTDEISATLQSVAPSYLYNRADKDTASAGRLWHSEHSSEQDEYQFSTFNPSGYCYSCVEYMAGDILKGKNPNKIYNDTTCISDYLILRTSAGDLSMIYFEYNAANTSVPVGVVTNTGSRKGGSYKIEWKDVSFKSQNSKATEALICNGTQSFSGIELKDTDITYGGYNGNFRSPSSKFISRKGFVENINVSGITANKSTYSKYKASQRASATFKLVNTFDVPDMTTSNGAYFPEDSSVFYKEEIRYGNGIEDIMEVENCSNYNGQRGFEMNTTYSHEHSKINDIIVHDPVTAQYSMLIPLDKSRDQRTDQNTISDSNYSEDNGECPDVADECVYAELNCEYKGNEYHTEDCYSIINETTHDDTLNAHKHTDDCYHKHTDACYNGSTSYDIEKVTKNSFSYNAGSGSDFHSFTAKAPGRVKFYSTYNNADPRGRVYVNGTLKVDNDDGNGNLNFKTEYVTFNKGDTIRLNVYNYGSKPSGIVNAEASIEYKRTVCGQTESDVEVHRHTTACYVNSTSYQNPISVKKDNFSYTDGSGTDFHTFTATASGRVKFLSTYNNLDPRGRIYVNGTLKVDNDDGNGSLNFNTGYVEFKKGDTVRLNIYNYGSRPGGVVNAEATIEYKNPTCGKKEGESTCKGEINAHVHTSTCYKTEVSYQLDCDEPHHSMNTKYTYYTAGWVHANGETCTGDGCKSCASNIKFASDYGKPFIEPAKITTDYVLIISDGEPYIAKKSDPTQCITTGETVAIDTHLENGKEVKSVFNLTKTNGASIHTKSLKDAVYHYSFGDDRCWDPCGNDHNHKLNPPTTNTPVGAYPTSGDFVNLDYGFQIYFPNTGNFYGNGAYGISDISQTTGKGYTTPMDTTTWLRDKYVIFDFDVIYDRDGDGEFSDDKLYLAGEKVHLGTFKYKGANAKNNFDDHSPGTYLYNFYVPLENSEKFNTNIQFCAVGLNSASGEWSENESTHNFERDNYRADHDATKYIYLDVVGRIGAMTMMDSGDFRFSNFFKQPVNSGWLVDNIVKEVDVRKQNWWLADPINIRGHKGTTKTNGLNTYGTQFFKSDLTQLLTMPLVPMYNNIDALKKQPQRIGYMNLMSMETIGNYYGEYSEFYPETKNHKLQIQPFYYHLDVNTGKWTPVDVYMLHNNSYVKINEFDNNEATTDHQWNYSLNWLDESARRMYSTGEKKATDNVVSQYVTVMNDSDEDNSTPLTAKIKIPSGREYQYGTAQMLFLRDKNRTFIGSNLTEGNTTNPGNRVYTEVDGRKDYDVQYQRQGQRWHFSLGLPSSAVFVEHGKPCVQENIDALTNDHSVIVTAVEVFAKGQVWTLKYQNNDVSNQKIQVTKDTPVWDYSNDPNGPGNKIVVTVTTTPKHSSKHDLQTEGTH